MRTLDSSTQTCRGSSAERQQWSYVFTGRLRSSRSTRRHSAIPRSSRVCGRGDVWVNSRPHAQTSEWRHTSRALWCLWRRARNASSDSIIVRLVRLGLDNGRYASSTVFFLWCRCQRPRRTRTSKPHHTVQVVAIGEHMAGSSRYLVCILARTLVHAHQHVLCAAKRPCRRCTVDLVLLENASVNGTRFEFSRFSQNRRMVDPNANASIGTIAPSPAKSKSPFSRVDQMTTLATMPVLFFFFFQSLGGGA